MRYSTLEPQGVWERFSALIIDHMILSLGVFYPMDLFLSVFFNIPSIRIMIENIQAKMAIYLLVIDLLVHFAAYVLYFTILEGITGQTVGKYLVGLMVVKEDGTRCDMRSAFVRNFLRIIDGFCGYLVGAMIIKRSTKKQRLGDKLAKTIVIKVRARK